MRKAKMLGDESMMYLPPLTTHILEKLLVANTIGSQEAKVRHAKRASILPNSPSCGSLGGSERSLRAAAGPESARCAPPPRIAVDHGRGDVSSRSTVVSESV